MFANLRNLIRLIIEDSMQTRRNFTANIPNIKSQKTKLPDSFQNSKMVDSNGNPLIFYHGTKHDFTQFSKKFLDSSGTKISTNYLGFYFTTSENIAKIYISKQYDISKGQHPSGTIQSFYLDIKKPYFITEKTYWKWSNSSPKEMESLVDIMKSKNYDGIIMPSVWRGSKQNGYDAVVFDSHQIIKTN